VRIQPRRWYLIPEVTELTASACEDALELELVPWTRGSFGDPDPDLGARVESRVCEVLARHGIAQPGLVRAYYFAAVEGLAAARLPRWERELRNFRSRELALRRREPGHHHGPLPWERNAS